MEKIKIFTGGQITEIEQESNCYYLIGDIS